MHDTSFLAWLYWNPNRVAFTIPFLNHPVVWYGIWFVLGLVVSYFLLIPMFRQRLEVTRGEAGRPLALPLLDRLTWFVIAGAIIGARLGHVFFYEWSRYEDHLLDIFKIWKGGLASHGGVIGILIALYFYQRSIRKEYPEFTFIALLDMLAVPSPFASFCIRIGNFFNQEILGTPTTVPWAIIFGDPADGSSPQPLHPAQLYEALAYLLTFIFLYTLWRIKGLSLRPGMLIGLMFICIFGSRFFIEFVKAHQSTVIDESFLQMGQYLSLPFVLLGIFLCFYNKFDRKNYNVSSSPK